MSMRFVRYLPMSLHIAGFRGLKCLTCQILAHGAQTFSWRHSKYQGASSLLAMSQKDRSTIGYP